MSKTSKNQTPQNHADHEAACVDSAKSQTSTTPHSSITSSLAIDHLGEEQQHAYDLLEKSHDNFFITGKAGTGKSVLLSYFAAHTKKNIAVLAPTGVAALNVGGQTIHSFFRLELGVQDTSNPEKVADLKKYQIKILRKLDAIIIDEISMVSADVLDMIDAKLKHFRGSQRPFGGCQVIVFGDLLQLPPIRPKGDALLFMQSRYRSIYFFDSHVAREHPFTIIELEQIFRQTDQQFVNLLNRIRTGEVDWNYIRAVNERCCTPSPDDNFITLASINATADQINEERLAMLPGKVRNYAAYIQGNIAPRDYPAPEFLSLRRGAHVMMLKNDYSSSDGNPHRPRWVNGTLATISDLDDEWIRIKIGHRKHKVSLEEWEKYRYFFNPETDQLDKEPIATFTQFPMKLAYAITIHKSQGQTYDAVKVDLGRGAFATGQTYVALSRCRSLDGLHLARPLRLSDIRVDRRVLEYLSTSS